MPIIQLNYARPVRRRSRMRPMTILTRIVGPIFCWALLVLFVLLMSAGAVLSNNPRWLNLGD